jgi:hypothetical protein
MNALERKFVRFPHIDEQDLIGFEAFTNGGGRKVAGISHKGLLLCARRRTSCSLKTEIHVAGQIKHAT